MRSVFKGKVYNTKTAREIAKADGRTLGVLNWFQERLMVTPSGERFLLGVGGELTRWKGDCGLVPLSAEQSAHWAQKHGANIAGEV